MIHVLNFEGEIVDFISDSDGDLIHAEHERNLSDRSEMFDFKILSSKTKNMQERNRIIIRDSNKKYREFIINRIEQEGDYSEIECIASYIEDIAKAKPMAPGNIEKKSTHESLEIVLASTGWEVSDLTGYGGNKTTSWASHQSRYDTLLQLCTTFSMKLDFYVELGSNTVDHRYVVLTERQPLFKGKEITYDKDLKKLKRIIDLTEVKTALLAIGPEQENGKRIELYVTDDEAQSNFGLPEHYIWGIYEPQTENQNMDEKRLRTLAKTELNKRNQQAISYEIDSIDIPHEYTQDEIVIGDMVRVKDRTFNPPMYIEAETIGEKYDLIADVSSYTIGKAKEFKESDLREKFNNMLNDIRQKVNDNISNVNTIVKETLAGELQYYERKIIKSSTPPENPVNDMFWLDTSNPEVSVLRRYWNGKWIKSSPEKASDIGAISREQALFSELNNIFINLSIQHSRLLKEVSEVTESEYLVNSDVKRQINEKLDATVSIYQQIKSNIESMTPETATIGKLIDTQSLFLEYRKKLQELYNVIENAKVTINERFKLLQSQYTDEKFNEAMNKVAESVGGRWDENQKQLIADIPKKEDLEKLRQVLILKQNEGLNSYSQKLEELQKEFKNLENGMELAVKKTIKEINGSGNLYRYSSPMAFKEAHYYQADVITAGDDKLINYRKRYKINFGALNYYKWETNTKYTFSFTIKTDTDGVVIDNLNDGYYDHSQNIQLPKDTWVRKSITFTPTYYLSDNGITLNLKNASNGSWYSSWVGGSNDIENVWVKDFQLEKGEIDTGQKVNTDDEQAVYDNINTKITEHSTKIQAFEDKINLKTYREEITQTLNQQLEPLKNDIKQQNSQIALLPDKLTETVSKKIYETTISGLVKRLEAEEAKRETLSNKINDTVSIQQYQAGINEARSYAEDKAKEAKQQSRQLSNTLINNAQRDTRNYINNQLKNVANNPEIQASIQKVNADAQEALKEYIRTQDELKAQEAQAYADGKISEEEQRAIQDAKEKFEEAKSHAENKADEAKRIANQYTESKATDTQRQARAYTDGRILNSNRERDQILSQYNTRITQNGRDINLRTTKHEFNATNRTLSNVLAEIVQNVTDGTTLRYDDNGVAQSLNIGPRGIKFDATKFEINDGDVVIQNGRTFIKDAYIDKLFAKQATLEYLKARDVDLNKATVSGTRNGESTTLSGGKIRSTGTFTRTFPQGNATYEAFTESWNGVYRSGLISKQFGNRRLDNVERWLALTDKEITTQREVHSMSPDKRGARFIDFFAEETYSSDVYGQGMHIYSGQDLKIEAGYRLSFESSNSWYTQFSGAGVEIINDGASLVLKRQTGFTSQQGSGGQYISLQASDGAVHGHLGIMSDNRHMVFSSTFGEVHLRGDITKVFNANGSNLSDIRARSFDLSGVGRIAFENGDAYLQGQTGVRFTKYKSNTFVTAQAKDFVKASSRHLKTNIKELENGLETIKNLTPVSYDYISDLIEGNTSGDIGFIAEDSPSISVNEGKAISVQKLATWAILGIKELIEENNKLKDEVLNLKIKFDDLSEELNSSGTKKHV
ncbi:TPA: tail fiber domain-containing protein [Staphylococcus aureus]|nr:tail fiber domain-containing protein [Staphylococcus aureus]